MPPPELAVSIERHASLHRCEECGAFWEQFERYTHTVSPGDVALYYGKGYGGGLMIFSPLNDLENALISTKDGLMSIEKFINILLKSNLVIPGVAEIDNLGEELKPFFFDKNGVQMLASFTDKSRFLDFNEVNYCLEINAFDFFVNCRWNVGL